MDKIDDAVLLKSDGFPTYHLANVVDDAGISTRETALKLLHPASP
jgi:hypothetical protein